MYFAKEDKDTYEQLKVIGTFLRSSFSKSEFPAGYESGLYNDLSRVYFPGCDFNNFTENQKEANRKGYS